jgi:exonuclease SbcC
LEATLKIGGVIKRASQRLGCAESVVVQREERIAGLRRDVERLEKLRAGSKLARERIAGIEREAGQASLKAQELSRRFGLTAEVPCAGTDLQGRCKLLSDAREAQSLKPSADAQIARLQEARAKVAQHLRDIEAQGRDLAAAPTKLNAAEANLKRSRERLARLSLRAARRGELAQAREMLAGIVHQIDRCCRTTARDREEKMDGARSFDEAGHRRQREGAQRRDSLPGGRSIARYRRLSTRPRSSGYSEAWRKRNARSLRPKRRM